MAKKNKAKNLSLLKKGKQIGNEARLAKVPVLDLPTPIQTVGLYPSGVRQKSTI